jgi:outer membrane murein-binding lipoprotein Lpp
MDYMVLLQSTGAALITAIATVFLGSRQMVNRARTEITAAEVKDRSIFREHLMKQIDTLRAELEVCKAEHAQANIRIARLEEILRENKITIVRG